MGVSSDYIHYVSGHCGGHVYEWYTIQAWKKHLNFGVSPTQNGAMAAIFVFRYPY